MSALITAGATDATATASVSGECRIIVSGKFFGSVSVVIEVDGDSLTEAIVYTFFKPGGVRLGTVNNDNVTATISGGNASTAIDVSLTST